MSVTDWIVIVILAVVIGLALAYIIRSKKKGIQCIGCPDSASCASCHAGGGSGCSGCSGMNSGCGSHTDSKNP